MTAPILSCPFCGGKAKVSKRIEDNYDDIGIAMTHPLNEVTFVITYVLSGCGLKEDYVVFGIKKFKGETE